MAKSDFGVLLFSDYLPVQKNARRARIGNLPVDIQIIQRAGVRVADVLIDPTFVQLTEIGFREDGAALGLVHSGAEQVLYVMHWHDYRRTGRVKGTEQILATAAHGALAVATLDVDCIAPIAACGAQELAEMAAFLAASAAASASAWLVNGPSCPLSVLVLVLDTS